MKMSYLQRSKRSSYKKHLLIIAVLLALGWLCFSLLGGVVVSLVAPIWRSENALSRTLRHMVENVSLHSSLVSENLALKEQVSSLELELAATSLSLSQEQTMGELLGRERRVGEIVATVLTRPPQSPYDLFVIDAGEADGITSGAVVSLPEGPVLGTISDVFPSSSKVKLFSTSGEQTEAVLERGNVPVILEGKGGGAFKIVVPRETVAMPGDRVLSTGLTSNLLAVVGGVEVNPTDSFKEILARSPANIFSVRMVSITP